MMKKLWRFLGTVIPGQSFLITEIRDKQKALVFATGLKECPLQRLDPYATLDVKMTLNGWFIPANVSIGLKRLFYRMKWSQYIGLWSFQDFIFETIPAG